MQIKIFSIGPESDHCLPLSLTDSCLVDLIEVTLECEDAKSKLADTVIVADVDAEKRVDHSFMLIRKLKFCHKVKFFI